MKTLQIPSSALRMPDVAPAFAPGLAVGGKQVTQAFLRYLTSAIRAGVFPMHSIGRVSRGNSPIRLRSCPNLASDARAHPCVIGDGPSSSMTRRRHPSDVSQHLSPTLRDSSQNTQADKPRKTAVFQNAYEREPRQTAAYKRVNTRKPALSLLRGALSRVNIYSKGQ